MIDLLWNPIFTVTEPQITKDRFSPWSRDHRWRSARIWFYIDCHYHNLRMLTRASCACKSPQEYMNMYKWNTASRWRLEPTRCSYKAFKWTPSGVSIRKKRKLWAFLQYRGREMYYSHEFSHFQKSFSFSVYIRNAHWTPRKNQTKMSAYVRLTCRT